MQEHFEMGNGRGIMPIFSQWTELREMDSGTNQADDLSVDNAKTFLWKLGVEAMPLRIFAFLAELIAKYAANTDDKFVLSEEYVAYSNGDLQYAKALRVGLTYHIGKNYDTVHQSLEKLCQISPKAFFKTNKKFVEVLAAVFMIYGKDFAI
ncbi:MAG: hypothetical protein HFE46_00060 [Clostridia bacterium]|nr:hypothetical protein [Clostridia bacterium]